MTTYKLLIIPALGSAVALVWVLIEMIGAPVYLKYKNKKGREALVGDDNDSLIECHETLERAQEWANNFDWRQTMAGKGFVVVEELHVIDGFDRHYMKWLVQFFSNKGLFVTYESNQGLPAGVGSYDQALGTYLLYCHHQDRERVSALLDELFKKEA